MHNRSSRRGKRTKGIEKVWEGLMTENFPNLKKESYPSTGGSEGPKQEEPKQTHTKAHPNQDSQSQG